MPKSGGQGEGAVTGTSETELYREGYLTGTVTFGREASTPSRKEARGKKPPILFSSFFTFIFFFVSDYHLVKSSQKQESKGVHCLFHVNQHARE